MEPKKSFYMNLRVNNIPDDKLSDIKAAALNFRKDVRSILKAVEITDDVYYDFNLTDSEMFDPEFDDVEYRRRRRNGRRV